MEELLAYLPLFDVDFSKVPVCQSQTGTRSEGLKVPKGKHSGVIIESRRHPMLELVLKNFVYMLPDWSLTIFHCETNKEFIESILGPKSTVKLVKLPFHTITIPVYNMLLTSEWFYQQIDAEKILIFQCDSFIRKSNIVDFLQYDYVGALCAATNVEIGGRTIQVPVFNGGLSLRDRELMLRIIKLPQLQAYREAVDEDVFFSIGTVLTNCNRCSPEVANSFSAEGICHPDPLGWHKGYLLKEWDILKTIPISLKVYYGNSTRFIEVSHLLSQWEKDGIVQLRGSYNELFGDPAPGQVKYLRLVTKLTIHIRENTPLRIARKISPPRVYQPKGDDKSGYFIMALLPDLDSLAYGDNLYKRSHSASLVSKPSLGLELLIDELNWDKLSNDKARENN